MTGTGHGHGVLRQLGGEAAVEPPRRIAEDAGEGVIEASALAGGHARPEVTQGIGAVLLDQPFEERRTSQIGHRQAEETVVGVELPVRRELAVHRPRAEDGSAHGARGTATAGDAAFDQRGVALQHPPRRVARDRIERDDVRQRALERIARRAKQMDEVGGLVDGQQVDPGRVLADLILRLGRLGEKNDARRVEEGDGDTVRLRRRILDDHVGDCFRGEPDLGDHRRPHRFEPLRRPRSPCLVLDRIVNAEVRRDDRPPWLMRRLGVNRRGEQQREEGETADHAKCAPMNGGGGRGTARYLREQPGRPSPRGTYCKGVGTVATVASNKALRSIWPCVHVTASGGMLSSISKLASPASTPASSGASISTNCFRSWNTTDALCPLDNSTAATNAGPGDSSSSTGSICSHSSRMSSRDTRRVRTVSRRGVVSGFAAAIGITVHPFHDRRPNRDDLAVTEIQRDDTLRPVAPIRELRRRATIRPHSCPELDAVLLLWERPDVRVNSSETNAITSAASDASANTHLLV